MKDFRLIYDSGIWLGIFRQFADRGIRHGISSRLGGISSQPFASLNLGLHTGDAPDAVRENRRRFSEAAGVMFSQVVTAEQIHGDGVFVVRREHAGRGGAEYNQAIAGMDALVTNEPDLPLMLFFADCVPVLIADPVRKVVAVSHAGWKGTVAAISAKTIQTMSREYGSNPADCIAGIGPSIGQCCYEVDDVVMDRLKVFPYWQDIIIPQGQKYRLDLWEANRRQLMVAGLAESNITVSRICTACNTELFFSYRAEQGKTGRIGAVIAI